MDEDKTHASTKWILDSGSGRYLVNDLSLLEDVVDCNHECFTAAFDGVTLKNTKQGSAMIRAIALGVIKTIRLLDFQYAYNLGCKLIYFGKLEKKRCRYEYREERLVTVSKSGGAPIMDVVHINDVLIVDDLKYISMEDFRSFCLAEGGSMLIMNGDGHEQKLNVQHEGFLHFHQRLGQICYNSTNSNSSLQCRLRRRIMRSQGSTSILYKHLNFR